MYNNIVCLFSRAITYEILAGVFWGLAIFTYFYQKALREKEILILKKRKELVKKTITTLKKRYMSEQETFQVKEILQKHVQDNEAFESEVRSELKSINSKITKEIRAVVQVLTDYIISNDNRVADLEGNQKTTRKEIAIYVGLIGTFVMLAINAYMSFKGG